MVRNRKKNKLKYKNEKSKDWKIEKIDFKVLKKSKITKKRVKLFKEYKSSKSKKWN